MKTYDEEKSEVRTWLEIDTEKLKHNYLVFRSLVKSECRLMAVVKSNAYGHGLIDYSKMLDKIGADRFAVDSFVEAKKLRENGIEKPILVLGYTLTDNYLVAARLNVSLTISSLEQLKKIPDRVSDNNSLKIHLKIDTGMHRQGLQLDELGKAIEILKNAKNVEVEGIYSHLADAKDPAHPEETHRQIEVFREAYKQIKSAGFYPIRHLAATAGTLAFSESHFDMVRVGIGLMGLWPSPEIRKKHENQIALAPALSWKTIISEIKSVPAGEGIGYGFSEKVMHDSRIAILPIGYWYGFKRSLSSRGHVLIHGRRCKVLGRVSMDMIIVDVTRLKSVQAGDTVTLIGRDGQEEISVEEVARLAGSYSYEIITTINPLIKKIYI